MSRGNMKGSVWILRQALQGSFSALGASRRSSAFSSSARSLISAPNSLFAPSTEFRFSDTTLPRQRSLCSAAGGENGVVIVKSEQDFTNAMNKAQDGSSPSLFYFTAAWCGPCKFISPVVVDLTKQYPAVTTYKVDIDEGELSKAIQKLNITAVPTLHFFKDGSKKGEVVGVDVAKLKSLMEQLYK